MSTLEDRFEVLIVDEEVGGFKALSQKPVSSPHPVAFQGAATAQLTGFDLEERPLLVGIPGHPRELIAAETTVPLRREHIGSTVVVLLEAGDSRRPIVVGVLQVQCSVAPVKANPPQLVSVCADDDRIELSADREIVLRCGDASITLTRSGKILIKGKYILSRSTGYNKIKGAAVDIN
jgi:hypothetical protein